ncbi:MAG TPA: polysaccharide biosynthesis/export family protein [Thermoanaerobaculia bacterium]|nr:polysaccharide biosynthesis/export family protein [Thermoanaerobaculia bacterium]
MKPALPFLFTAALSLLLSLALPSGGWAGVAQDDRGLASEPEDLPDSGASDGERVGNSFLLGPEDVIEVFVWKEDELSTTATVRPDGRITLPLVGELPAEGRTPRELQEEIAEKLERYIALPVVTVSVQAIHSRQISVMGEVRRPGRYRLGHQTTVLDAVAMGGGFTEFANKTKVTVLRPTPSGIERISINLKRLMRSGGSMFYLEPKDTVQVDG